MTYLIQYDGVPMGNELQQFVAQFINNYGICPSGVIKIMQYDGDINVQQQEHPVKAAITVIGQKFSAFLVGPNKNDTMFAVNLWNTIQTDSTNVVRKAVHILATQSIVEFVHLANSYGLGNPELDVIRSINQFNPYNL